MTLRRRLARHLHAWAGRLDPAVDFRCATSLTLTLEAGQGWVLHFGDDQGLPVWYRNPEYRRAHDDASVKT